MDVDGHGDGDGDADDGCWMLEGRGGMGVALGMTMQLI